MLLAGSCGPGIEVGDGFWPFGETAGEDEVGTTTSGGEASRTTSEDSSEPDEADSTEGGIKLDVATFGDVPAVGGGLPKSCEQALESDSSVGCEFFYVRLPDNNNSPFLVSVANPHDDQEATVWLETLTKGAWIPHQEFELEPRATASQQEVIADADDTALLFGAARRIRSSVPVIAYQLAAADASVSSTDASTLLPLAGMDDKYMAVVNPTTSGVASRTFVAVVGIEDGTAVTITPTADTAAGPGLPAVPANADLEFEVDEADVAVFQTAAQMQDLTGTRIEADGPVVVFVGSECSHGPGSACERLEEQLAPLSQWGTAIVAPRYFTVAAADGDWQAESDTSERFAFQIVASEDDTSLSVHHHPDIVHSDWSWLPSLPAGDPVLLAAGAPQWYVVEGPLDNPGDVYFEADKPIAVMGYSGAFANHGDPSQAQYAPVGQYLSTHTLFLPSSWGYNYITLTRSAGNAVQIDGVPVDEALFVTVTGTNYEVARVLVDAGLHTVESDNPIGVVAAGFDHSSSYAYVGATGTAAINPEG